MNLLDDIGTMEYLNRTIVEGEFDNPDDEDYYGNGYGDIFEIIHSSDDDNDIDNDDDDDDDIDNYYNQLNQDEQKNDI